MKEKLKRFLKGIASKLDHPVVVASCGRSGSTMIFNTIAKSSIKFNGIIQSHWIKKKIWNIDQKKYKGIVYKTHDTPPSDDKVSVKYLYVYDCPVKVLASTIRKAEKNERWWRNHKKHMNSNCKEIEKLKQKDCLKIKENIIKWNKFCSNRVNAMSIKYDSIWEKEKEIEDLIGVKISLPEKKQRKSSINRLDIKVTKNLIKMYEKVYKKTEVEKPKI